MAARLQNPHSNDVERGAGIFSSVFGLMFFLVFLLLAVQVLWSLYATSVVTGAAYDAGRLVARSGNPEDGHARFETVVGSYDAQITISMPTLDGPVTVELTGQNPTMLPDQFARVLPFGDIERTIEIREEEFVGER
ncbi:MAG: hypothetical protein ACR2PK_09970 [Acidimicrobiales bacterium]